MVVGAPPLALVPHAKKALPQENPHDGLPIWVPSGGGGEMTSGWQASFLHLPSLVMPPSTDGEQPLQPQPAGHLSCVTGGVLTSVPSVWTTWYEPDVADPIELKVLTTVPFGQPRAQAAVAMAWEPMSGADLELHQLAQLALFP
jgi:hypothetical protein